MDRAAWRAAVCGVLKCWTGEGNDSPLQYSCLENSMDRGAWRATVYVVARVGHDWTTKHVASIAQDAPKMPWGIVGSLIWKRLMAPLPVYASCRWWSDIYWTPACCTGQDDKLPRCAYSLSNRWVRKCTRLSKPTFVSTGFCLFRLYFLSPKLQRLWLGRLESHCVLPFVSPRASLTWLWLGALMALGIVLLVLCLVFMADEFPFRVTIHPILDRVSQNNFLVWKINCMVSLDNRREMLDLVIITNLFWLYYLEEFNLLIWC